MTSKVKKGDWVTVRQTTATNGHKTLTVSRSKAKSSKTSS
jgi:hypothetical protein